MRRGFALVLLTLAGGIARADEPPRPSGPPVAAAPAPPAKPAPTPTPEQAADAVLAAVKARDDAALKSLAAKDEPDPWLVADVLVSRGQREVAARFASLAPRKSSQGLSRVVAARSDKVSVAALRDGLVAAATARKAGDVSGALRVLDALAVPKDDFSVAGVLRARGESLACGGKRREAVEGYRGASVAALRAGWVKGAADALSSGAEQWLVEREWALARTAWEEAIPLFEALGDLGAVGFLTGNVGNMWEALGKPDEELVWKQRSLTTLTTVGNLTGIAWASRRLSKALLRQGRVTEANRAMRVAAEVAEQSGDKYEIAHAMESVSMLEGVRGAFARALDAAERAVVVYEEIGDDSSLARMLGNLGLIYANVGDNERAAERLGRAIAVAERVGAAYIVSAVLGTLARVRWQAGDPQGALELAERCLRLRTQAGEPVAVVLGMLGNVRSDLGQFDEAESYQRRSLDAARADKDATTEAIALVNLADISARRGLHEEAVRRAEEAERAARRAGSLSTVIVSLSRQAWSQLDLDRPARTLELVRRVAEAIPELVQGLGDEQAAMHREQYSQVFGAGVIAAVRLKDPDAAGEMMELGRGAALLEALGNRAALMEATVPSPLLAADVAARAAESRAIAALRDAFQRGDLVAAREGQAALDLARTSVQVAAERIQRESRRGGNIVYPKPASMAAIRRSLGEGEAMVIYGFFARRAYALILSYTTSRVVDLGEAAPIEALCANFVFDDVSVVPSTNNAVARLVTPLALGAEVRRVLISPHGPLSGLPFSLLLEGRDVSYAASGTSYLLLAEDAKSRGTGVLAVGDPVYDTRLASSQRSVQRGVGARLAPLPGSRGEVMAVGTTVLLGENSTERHFAEALATRKYWRAVHFACHGLVDQARPLFCALAITPDEADDGYLTTLEILRMRIPADLVVLSACQTAKGREFASEGVFGLTRAFMFAGAPRVICSLWKVDDDATRALMVKFYELWNPKDGKPGLPTAEALRKAQEFVKSQEKWKHPYYWAAWVLWGLAD